jgi:hypothetical protein
MTHPLLRAVLDVKRETSTPHPESNPDSQVLQSVVQSLYRLRLMTLHPLFPIANLASKIDEKGNR